MASRLHIASLLLFCLVENCYGAVLFSSLKRTLVVTASPKAGEVLKAGEEQITVNWGLNQSFPASTDSAYKTVKVKLCYAPLSQEDRSWRKTNNDLSKDKTCQHSIVSKPYDSSTNNVKQSFDWIIERDVPTATYFVRAYAYNSDGDEVGYGQTTDAKKTTNLFEIQGISGRHASLDIAAACFSAFSLVSLLGFFYLEKKKAKMSV
ncbi:high-affinity nitrate transporter 3.2-like [Macadamia integrifolia]|uniref:high-affinity nitrate transporter 3.2-like n=1 Tax=Macadamia integrifolia TaxID=60698 RepID=UPI001C4FBC58|nr:high-affinity nitrate transporter 3.2-like [Macadamia integrifolia]